MASRIGSKHSVTHLLADLQHVLLTDVVVLVNVELLQHRFQMGAAGTAHGGIRPLARRFEPRAVVREKGATSAFCGFFA